MPLVPALCTQCGAKLEVDSSQDAAVCPFCHTAFITEKAINNYNTTIVNNIDTLHADVVKINDDQSIDNRVKSGETFLKMNDYYSAQNVFSKLTEECPYDYRGWWGLIKVVSQNFSFYGINIEDLNYIRELYSRLITVINDEERKKVDLSYKPYIIRAEEELNKTKANLLKQIDHLNQKFEAEKESIETNINRLEIEKKETSDPAFVVGVILFIIVLILGAYYGLKDGFGWFLACCAIWGIPAYGIGYIVCGILSSTRNKKIAEIEKYISNERIHLNGCTKKYGEERNKLQDLLRMAGGE